MGSNCNLQGQVPKDIAYNHLVACQSTVGELRVGGLADVNNLVVNNLVVNNSIVGPFPVPDTSVHTVDPIIGNGSLANPVTLTPGLATGDILQWNSGTTSWNVVPLSLDSALPLIGDGTSVNPFTLTPGTLSGDTLQWNSGTTSWDVGVPSVISAAPLTGVGTAGNPITLAPGTNNGDILQWNSGTTSWDSLPITVDAALPLIGDGTSGNPLTFSPGINNGDVLSWNSGTSTWDVTPLPPSGALTSAPCAGNGLIGTPITFATGSATTNTVQWNNSTAAWSLARSPGTTEVTVGPGSGALYADVATAIAAGSYLIRVIGNTTEPSTLTITTNTIIYIDPGVTYTTNSLITVGGTGNLLIMGNSAQNSIWTYNSAGGAIISAAAGQSVAFRQLQIINNSAVGSTPIVNGTARITMQSVLVTLPNGLSNTFLGSNTTVFTRLILNTVQLVGNNSSLVLQSTTDSTTGEIQVSTLTLTGTWSGTAISALQSRATWNQIVYQSASNATFNLQGTIQVFKALNGSGAVTLNIAEQTASGSPTMSLSDINLGFTVASVLSLTTTSAVGTTVIEATNVIVNTCNVSGPNIIIANIYCLFMNPTGLGANFKMTNAQCTEFTTTLTLGTASELTNVVTNGTTGSVPFATIVSGTGFTIRNWVQFTGRLQLDTVTNSTFSGCNAPTTADATAGVVVTNCTNCSITDMQVEQGMLCSNNTSCNFANINATNSNATGGFVVSGSNNRISNIQVGNGTFTITGQGHQVANSNIARSSSIGTSSATCTDCIFANNMFALSGGTITLDGPAGTTEAKHIFGNNLLNGTVSIGGAAGRIVTNCQWDSNRFNAAGTITTNDAACANHKFTGNTFTVAPTTTFSAPNWQFSNNAYDVVGTITLAATAVGCLFVGNRYFSGTTFVIPAMAASDAPLFVGNINSAGGVATGPTNSHANSTGNT